MAVLIVEEAHMWYDLKSNPRGPAKLCSTTDPT